MRVEPRADYPLTVPQNPKPPERDRLPKTIPAYVPPPPLDMRGHLLDRYV